MCRAFSCIVDKYKKVYWKLNLDSHGEIIEEFKLKEKQDSVQWVRVEIAPKNGSYLKPDKWVFKVDEHSVPDWFSPAHKEVCMKSFRVYKKQLYAIVVRKPIVHPFKIRIVKRVSLKQKLLLKEWDSVSNSVNNSVWDSVWDSVWNSVRDSVWNSVGNSVWDSVSNSVRNSVRNSVWNSVRNGMWNSVGDSVWDSVRNSIHGYVGSFFKLKRDKWRYTEKINVKGSHPFQSVVDLWNMGIIPSFDGTTWRLHSGPKAKVIYEITEKELQEIN